MQKTTFYAQGSEAEPYEIDIEYEPGNVRAACTCQAGRNGMACKHRMELLRGPVPVGVTDLQALDAVRQCLTGSPLETALIAAIEADETAALAKTRLTAARRALARVMDKGR